MQEAATPARADRSGGRVLTRAYHGPAGVVPAVLGYVARLTDQNLDQARREEHVLTSAGIGMRYKKNASLSAAEMGCQGEIGVSCLMATGGLAAVLGATNAQIENDAEIGMEHNLDMTCDAIGGLVQVSCIERNSMEAIAELSNVSGNPVSLLPGHGGFGAGDGNRTRIFSLGS